MEAERLPHFAFYPGDFMGSTGHMNSLAVGCYIRLLCFQWQQGSLPDDIAELNCMAPDLHKVWKKLECKFPVGADGRRRNGRLEKERDIAEEKRRSFSERGSKGGRPKKLSFPVANAEDKQHCFSAAKARASESVSVSESPSVSLPSVSEGSVRGDPPIDPFDISESSSARYSAMTNPIVRGVWDKIPKDWRETPNDVIGLALAIFEVARTGRTDQSAAGKVVLGKLLAYHGSRKGRGGFRVGLKRFFAEGMYEGDEEAWNHVGEAEGKTPAVRESLPDRIYRENQENAARTLAMLNGAPTTNARTA